MMTVARVGLGMYDPGVIVVGTVYQLRARSVTWWQAGNLLVCLSSAYKCGACKRSPPSPRSLPIWYAPRLRNRYSQNAMNLLTVAWQQRASVWKPLEDDLAVSLA